MDANREYDGRGLFNDVVTNAMKIGLQAFDKEEMEYLPTPKYTAKVNPANVAIEDLPAFFVYMPSLSNQSDSLGQGNSSHKLSEQLDFQVNYQYIIPSIEGQDGAERLREVSWFLMEHLIANKNLNDLAKNAKFRETEMGNTFQFVGDKLQPVTQMKVPVLYTGIRKMKQSTRINDRYK